jgi:MFS transporter, NHS family, xanthosine permease
LETLALHKAIKTRLSTMMFLQYFASGATWPIMSLYLTNQLHFSGAQAGMVLAMSCVAAVISPWVGACVADRVISAERLLAFCHFVAATLMLALSTQTEFTSVLVLYLGYTLMTGPTVALTNAITFHNAPGGNKDFGNIRMWGTIGWIVVAWAFSFLWLRHAGGGVLQDRLPDALKLSAISSAVLGLYTLTLPKAGRRIEGPVRLFPHESLRVFVRPQILWIAAASLLIGIVDRYHYFGMAPYLRHLGFSDASIMPSMSVGQMVEAPAMAILGWMLARLGIKFTLILGIGAEIWRFLAFAWGGSIAIVFSGIFCHGLAYAFFFTAVYTYIDGHCDKTSRTGLHQIFSIITSGVGSLAANLLAGACMDHFVPAGGEARYVWFWLVPAGLSMAGLAVICLAFKDKAVSQAPEAAEAPSTEPEEYV